MPTTPTLTQDAAELNFQWVQDDPVYLEWIVQDAAGWVTGGDYRCDVRKHRDHDSERYAEMTVVVTVEGLHARFAVSLADSSGVPPTGPNMENGHYMDIQQIGGVTRFRGRASVLADVTVPA